ncbi:MAG TPA: UDP-N-acetylmuramoyl-L-alanyl-D-glutamate--2,6-diaminopimelate ligase [Acidimicrobiales bacterium]|nr:UDP-N-acetylmuramoyl-L-alanyl-D-glutamate--2,6-diaminopimelate ligase [Acidimicrobiales bacterium]
MRLDRVVSSSLVLDFEGDPATEISDVVYLSSDAAPGTLFCCLRGRRSDGHDHAPDAVVRGASALLVERRVERLPRPVPQVRVGDARHAMALAAAELHGNPSAALTVVGITGTNGKSTTARFVQALLDAAGRPCGLIGTMTGERTTPEAPDLQRELARFVRTGHAAAAVEVSSVGLVQRRVDGTRFAAGVFTNLSQDELWIHRTMEDYFRAKRMLFEAERTTTAVVNRDDEWGRRLLAELAGGELALHPFSVDDAADLDVGVTGSRFRWRGHPVELRPTGAHNVSNGLAALTAAVAVGVAPDVATEALSRVPPLPGHGQPIDAGQPFRVVVDFAHTAGALAAVLSEARRAAGADGRVVVVFGCGGDRDPGRRGPMGQAAAQHADVVVVTSDNPRTEDPAAILAAVADGARDARDLRVVEDRRQAIVSAIAEARESDVVVIAGKGHETGQIIGDTTLPFDDAEVARDALAAAGYQAVQR